MGKDIKDYLIGRSVDIAEEWTEFVEIQFWECEREGCKLSPIEKLFLIEWFYRMETENAIYSPNTPRFYIFPQHNITTKGNKYRVDFLIYYGDKWNPEDKKVSLIVELDSYLWHGKTPEQFEKDIKRERDLIEAGYKVIRFSGREIVRDVESCVEKVIQYMKEIWFENNVKRRMDKDI